MDETSRRRARSRGEEAVGREVVLDARDVVSRRALLLIRGPEGSTLRLELIGPDGKKNTVELMRRKINL